MINFIFRLLYEYSLEYPDDIKIIYCVIGTNAETDIRTVTLTSQEKLESNSINKFNNNISFLDDIN